MYNNLNIQAWQSKFEASGNGPNQQSQLNHVLYRENNLVKQTRGWDDHVIHMDSNRILKIAKGR